MKTVTVITGEDKLREEKTYGVYGDFAVNRKSYGDGSEGLTFVVTCIPLMKSAGRDLNLTRARTLAKKFHAEADRGVLDDGDPDEISDMLHPIYKDFLGMA